MRNFSCDSCGAPLPSRRFTVSAGMAHSPDEPARLAGFHVHLCSACYFDLARLVDGWLDAGPTGRPGARTDEVLSAH